jgi:transketolase
MEINSRTIRTFSMLGQRGSMGTALLELARKDDRIMALVADVGSPSGLDRLASELPGQFLNVGIAEQNMIGVAAGLSANGHIPFAFTLANFATMRAGEQVRHFMGYMKEPVKLVGFGGGFAMAFFGNTHYGIEDIGAIRSIENIVVLSPADGLETVKAAYAAAQIDAPVYIRLTGLINTPVIYSEDFDFRIGKANRLHDGRDVVIFATGVVTSNALKAAEILDGKGISTAIVDMHTIKPIDTDVLEAFRSARAFVTVEEHNIIGGLGSAVSEYITAAGFFPKLIRIGVSHSYLPAGDYQYKILQNGLDAESIAARICRETAHFG